MELTAAIESTMRNQDLNSFLRRIQRAVNVTTTHIWRRDMLGVVSCVETQERDMDVMGQQVKGFKKDIVQHQNQNFDLQEEAKELNDKLSNVRDQCESLQRQYSTLAQSLRSVQHELATSRESMGSDCVESLAEGSH